MASITQSGIVDLPIEQSILHFAESIKEKQPDLHELIKNDVEMNVDHDHFFTKILGIFKNYHPEVYDQVLEKRPKHHRDAINKCVDGEISADKISHVLQTAVTEDGPVTVDDIVKHPVAHDSLIHKTFSSHPGFSVFTKVSWI